MAERRRSRTYPAWGCQTSPVLKTSSPVFETSEERGRRVGAEGTLRTTPVPALFSIRDWTGRRLKGVLGALMRRELNSNGSAFSYPSANALASELARVRLSRVAENVHRTLAADVLLYVRRGSAGRIVAIPSSST